MGLFTGAKMDFLGDKTDISKIIVNRKCTSIVSVVDEEADRASQILSVLSQLAVASCDAPEAGLGLKAKQETGPSCPEMT